MARLQIVLHRKKATVKRQNGSRACRTNRKVKKNTNRRETCTLRRVLIFNRATSRGDIHVKTGSLSLGLHHLGKELLPRHGRAYVFFLRRRTVVGNNSTGVRRKPARPRHNFHRWKTRGTQQKATSLPSFVDVFHLRRTFDPFLSGVHRQDGRNTLFGFLLGLLRDFRSEFAASRV